MGGVDMVNIGSGLTKARLPECAEEDHTPSRGEIKTALNTYDPHNPARIIRRAKVVSDPAVVQVVRKYMATKKHQWAKPNTQPDYLLCVGLLKKYGEEE
jgi:hypothetical protein